MDEVDEVDEVDVRHSAGVAVGVPGMGPPTWGLVRSLLGLRNPADCGTEDNWTFLNVVGRPVEDARNELVERFLRTRREWLLFVDSDAVLHPDTLLRLLSWQVPVVGALAFTRYTPPMPIVYAGHSPAWAGLAHPSYAIQVEETRQWLLAHPALLEKRECAILDPAPADSLRQVDFTGCHCLLIHRQIVEALPPPWFERARARDGWTPGGTGEDYLFCQRVHTLRVPIYVDRSVVAGHVWGERPLAGLDFMAWTAITTEIRD
jgi:hypothetical protein